MWNFECPDFEASDNYVAIILYSYVRHTRPDQFFHIFFGLADMRDKISLCNPTIDYYRVVYHLFSKNELRTRN